MSKQEDIKEQGSKGEGVKDTKQNSLDRKGNIQVLATNSTTFQNLGSEFLNHPKIIGKETRVFGLGVPESSVVTGESSSTPKYYKDLNGGTKEYNDGKELIEISEKISNTMKTMQEKFGDKNYPPKVQRELEEEIGKNWGQVTTILDPDPAGNALRDAKSPYAQTGPNYADVLDRLKQVHTNLEKISQRLEKEPTIAYGTVSATSQNNAIPTDVELKNALSKVIFEQEKITGISFKDPDFKTKLDAIKPKDLGKIEILIENGTNKQSTKYKISPENFLKTLKEIDPKSIPNQDVSFHNLSTTQRSEVRKNINTQLENAKLNPEKIIKPDSQRFPNFDLKNTLKWSAKSDKSQSSPNTDSPSLTREELAQVGKIAFLEDVKKIVEAQETKGVGKQEKPKRPGPLTAQEIGELKAQQAPVRPVSQAPVKNNETSVVKPDIEEQKKDKPSLAKQLQGMGYDVINALRDKAILLIQKSGLDKAYDKIKGVAVAFKNDPKSTMKGIKEETKDALGAVKSEAKDALGAVKSEAKDALGVVKSEAKDALGAVKSEAKDVLKTAKQDVKDLVKANLSQQEYKNLKDTKKNLEQAAHQIHDSLKRYLPGKGGEHSPKQQPRKNNEKHR